MNTIARQTRSLWPVPLGDLGTPALVRALLHAWHTSTVDPELLSRGAGVEDVRRELRRREVLGVGVRP
jgi:hypothetical protein